MNFDMTRFKTLMLREWLQNRWTWLIAVGVIPALALVALPFGQARFDEAESASLMAAGAIGVSALVCTVIAWLTTGFSATSLARRDVQDRSIEFWLSLPSTHTESIGAQYLMHALVFPLGALLGGLVFGLLFSPMLVVKGLGMAGLAQVAWGATIVAALKCGAIAAAGLVFVALWMAGPMLLLMAAAAWVKRLALPLLAIASIFLANYGELRYIVRPFAEHYTHYLKQPIEGVASVFIGMNDFPVSARVGISAGEYFSRLLQNLATPEFAIGIAVALGCGYLLAVKRRMGG